MYYTQNNMRMAHTIDGCSEGRFGAISRPPDWVIRKAQPPRRPRLKYVQPDVGARPGGGDNSRTFPGKKDAN